MSDMLVLPCPRLLLDACCAITLYHSGHMSDILEVAAQQVGVASYVLDHELVGIDIRLLIEAGKLAVLTPTGEAEELAVVNLAAVLDDGEAHTGAIAAHRSWAIATDDIKAINFLSRSDSSLTVVTTPELVRHWADTRTISSNTLRAALRAIATHAVYRPRRSHRLAAWWAEHS